MSENSALNASSSSTIQQDVYEPPMAKKKAPQAQVWTLMALVAIMPFSFELIFPFVNQVSVPQSLYLLLFNFRATISFECSFY